MSLRIVHLITGLGSGGAEQMLYKLLSRMDPVQFHSEVISLTGTHPVGEQIQALGVRVRGLGISRSLPSPTALIRLVGWLRQSSPDLLQTWMYHSDLIGSVASRLAGKLPVVWNIRHGELTSHGNKRRTFWTARLCAQVSRRIPHQVICCSNFARETHVQMGYAAEKMTVIPNGFDIDAFRPAPEHRLSVRSELDLAPDSPLIGLVARFHPLKDHHTFVEAAAQLHKSRPDVHFVLCGPAVSWDNAQLVGWIDHAGLRHRFHLLGGRTDIPRLTAAFDVATCCSTSEAFPNVVGEAMACGVPCVVTDVGDSAMVVGNTGVVVPPGEPAILASAWAKLVNMSAPARARWGESARERVVEHFALPAVVGRYEQLYKELIWDVRHRRVS